MFVDTADVEQSAVRERTRDQVRRLHAEGLTQVQIARALGTTKSTNAYHLRRLGNEPDDRFSRRYDWAEVQAYYDEGHSITDCQRRFGFARRSFTDAQKRGEVATRPHKRAPIAELLVVGREHTNRSNLRIRLISEGLKPERCELRPNCHSQTDTWGGRNKAKLKIVRDAHPRSGAQSA